MKNMINVQKNSQEGAVLIEALIAVLVFSTGILALAGLQSSMLKNTDEARYRAEASFIAQQKIGEMWTNSKNFATLADYEVEKEPVLDMPNGKRSVSVDSNRVVTVTINWTIPGSDERTYIANTRIEGM